MKKLLITAAIFSAATAAQAEFYKAVSRVDQDLYKTTDGRALIQTKYCYEYATYEEAILQYERYSYDNRIIFDSGTACEVDKVLSL